MESRKEGEQLPRTRLHRSGLEISQISFGCSSIGNLYQEISEEAAHEVLQAAWDAGIRYFDVSPFYGFGLAEQRLGRFLAGKKGEDYVVSTKAGRSLIPVDPADVPKSSFVNPLPYAPGFDYSYDGLMRSFEATKQRMPDNSVDILYIHDIGERIHGPEENAKHVKLFLDGGLRAVEEIKKYEGLKSVGLGVNEVEICIDLAERADLDLFLLAGRYTLLDRRAEPKLLPMCQERNMQLVIGGVYNSGILATGAKNDAHFDYKPAPDEVVARVKGIEAVCNKYDVPIASASLQFPRNHPAVASVLIGTGKVSSLQRSLRGLEDAVPPALWQECDAIARADGGIQLGK
ncbi:aldo/keto reductase [Polycladidibacter hongkongensis]|uniref:aldo/keto reductase n=1 Tax=Polycladidibacter hongkongensis TaxID=1647556 RepID=UPI00083142DB|nr:aldo/keto reductase [Pseudovibrio hongkongensis]